jgi:flagellar hook protein FlgE
MASTTALLTGLSGMNANSRMLDVIGNNISNANTYGYKSSRMLFSSMFARTLSTGTAPGATIGGTNPSQIGLGTTIAGTQRSFRNGTISTTGDARDLGIEGEGMFIVSQGNQALYTRAGAFRQNSTNDLVAITGERLMGYTVDAQFNLQTATIQPLNVPIGTLTLAEASTEVGFSGNLRANGAVPTHGAQVALNALASPSTGFTDTTGAVVATTTLLTAVQNANLALGNALFTAGQIIEVKGAEKGLSGSSNRTLPTAQYTVTATSTVQDFMTFIAQAAGIDTTAGANPDGIVPGVALDPLTGEISINGNTGTGNDLTFDTADINLLSSAGVKISNPFIAAKTQTADGESVHTSFVVYDSLGAAVQVDATMSLVSKGASGGTTWRYIVESGDDSDLAINVGAGNITFDDNGKLTTTTPVSVTIDRANTGATTPLTFQLNMGGTKGNMTALADNGSAAKSSMTATFVDGAPIGTLNSFAVGADGVITGTFSNGLGRTVGQVALAKFANYEGLVDAGNNMYTLGPNSGTAQITTPQALGTGKIVGGALELSNVDLGKEFIDLIQAQTGYSAATRIITTTNELMQQLLALGR